MNAIDENLRGHQNVLGYDLRAIVHSSHLRNLLGFGLFVVAFYFAYSHGMSSFSQVSASPFWIPDSILLCALLMSPPRRWWIFVLAPLPIRLFVGATQNFPLWFLLATFAIDSAKGLLAAAALRRFRQESHPSRNGAGIRAVLSVRGLADSGRFGLWRRHGTLLFLGFGYWAAWEQWFLGDALAQLVVTPIILYFISGLH